MAQTLIHIFFSTSAAGTFRQMLASRRIDETVIDCPDDLSFGPISRGSLAERAAWFDRNMPTDFGPRDWLGESEERFAEAIRRYPHRLIWLEPASAVDQAGLYWYLSKFGGDGLTLAVADHQSAPRPDGPAPLTLGALNMAELGRLYDRCARTSWPNTQFEAGRWDELIADGALLRVIENGVLQSVSDDYFDPILLARCPQDWSEWRRVIGYAMVDVWDSGHWIGDEPLIWRLRSLIESGHIECLGGAPSFGFGASDGQRIRRSSH